MNRHNIPVPRLRVRIEILAMLALAVAVSFSGYWFYNFQKRDIEQDVHRHLQEIVALKVAEIAAWRGERFGDARVLMTLTGVADRVNRELIGRGDPATERDLSRLLDSIRRNYGYASVAMTDANGNIRALSGELMGPPEVYRRLAAETAASGTVVMREFGPGGVITKPHFTLAAGLTSAHGERIGALLAGIDPAVYLYPSVLRWPAPTRTGQVILLRREANDVVFLSALEGVPDAAMTVRRSLSNHASIAVRAALGETEVDGVIGGANGHPEQVEGAAGRVPDSDWFVLANMHADEAYERLKQIQRAIWIFGGLFLLVSISAMEVIRRRQQSKFYRRLYEAEMDKQTLRGHYDFLTRYANDAFLLVDSNNRILEANDRAVEFFGYTREELLSLDSRKLRPPELRPQLEETWRNLLAKRSMVYELEMQRKDGSRFPGEVSIRLLEVEGRQLAQSITRDITERKQAEQQIRRLNRLYLVLSRCSEAVISAQSEHDLFQRVCHIAVELGELRAALVHTAGHAGNELQPVAQAGVDVGYLDNALVDAFGTEGAFACCNDIAGDERMILWKENAIKQGLRSWIAFPLKRGRKAMGRLSLFSSERSFFNAEEIALAEEIANSISFALDAQERDRLRREAERELAHSRERLELVLDATDEGYWDWNLVTGEGHQSLRYDTMLGYEPGTLRADFTTWRAQVNPDDQAALLAATETLRKRDTFSVELRLRCRSGNYIWCLCRGKVVTRQPDGSPARLVGTNTDITSRKKLEDQFLQAQKLESVGRLAGGVAHDFNNLLTVINGYSDLVMARMGRNDALRKMMHQIREAGETAAGLTRQLLTFSRKQVFDPKPLHLNEVVGETRNMLGRLVGEDIEIVTRFWASPDNVLVDRNQIHQCVMNLVVNARDAMSAGGKLTIETINVEVSAGDLVSPKEASPGPYVVLSVVDTGTGIDEATRARIFEPFFTTKEMGKGTGLGLATVYGIVRQCSGFIRVESEIGQGTAFRLYFPGTHAGAERQTSASTPEAARGSETVLLVEDQKNVRAFLAEALADLGYSVVQAGSGSEAILAAERHAGPIHLLLTDMIMPGMNGRELAHSMQEIRPSLKVLFMSGYAGDVGGNQAAIEPGMIYIQKPFAPEELAAKMREALMSASSPATAD